VSDVKQIMVRPIAAAIGKQICKENHYSRKVVPNSQIHLGAFLHGRCLGVMQFGPSMDRNRMCLVVRGTKPREMLELNRMAFSDELPRNSESRCLGFALRLIAKTYPTIKWVVSFADACQCGDGAIYRACNFVLTSIKKNTSLLTMGDGKVVARKTLDDHIDPKTGRFMSAIMREKGAKPLVGYQLRYIYFLHPDERQNLTCPEIPYSAIDECGARMYKGVRPKHSGDAVAHQAAEGGSTPTRALHQEA